MAENYNSAYTVDDGTCRFAVAGCTSPIADNYNSLATSDDGTCMTAVRGCMDSNNIAYNDAATIDTIPTSCNTFVPVPGCMIPSGIVPACVQDGPCVPGSMIPSPFPSGHLVRTQYQPRNNLVPA